MPIGIQGFNGSGTKIFDSATMGAYFLGASTSTSTSVDNGEPSGFSNSFSIATTTERFSLARNGSNYFYNAYVGGDCDGTAGQFYTAPTWRKQSGVDFNPYSRIDVYGLNMNVYTFGTRPATTGYGISVVNNSDQAAFDQTYKSLFCHADSNGNIKFSATASSLPANTPPSGRSGFAINDPTVNITFPYPLDTAPLIFVRNASGSIAFVGFTKDANGKFNGAIAIAPSNIGIYAYGGGNWQYPMTAVTPVTFDYYIVSPDLPQYPLSGSAGVQVFNSAGAVTFDTRYAVPSFLVATGYNPKISATSTNWSFDQGGYVYWNGTSAIAATCLNQFQAITACTVRGTIVIISGGVTLSSCSWFGQYLAAYDGYAGMSIAGTYGNEIFSYSYAASQYYAANFVDTSKTRKVLAMIPPF
jgi:hypothetical protein